MMPAKAEGHSIIRIASNLALACFFSGVVIGAVYYVTAPIAAEKAEAMKQDSMRTLVQEAESFQAIEGEEGCFAARKEGKTIAYIVPSEAKGYGGKIKMLVAVTAKGRVIDFNILEHNETPGLGDNAQKPAFRDQFKGRRERELGLTKDNDKAEAVSGASTKGSIQAMTGATISSRAVTRGVREGVAKAKRLIKEGK